MYFLWKQLQGLCCLYFICFQKGIPHRNCSQVGGEGNPSCDVKTASQPTKRVAHHGMERGVPSRLTFLPADGLTDCMDPDCCLQSSCQNQPYCRGLPDPQDIISQSLQSPSQQAAKSFYDRISFLIGAESTHVLPGESPFNKRLTRLFLIRSPSDIGSHTECCWLWVWGRCCLGGGFPSLGMFFTRLHVSALFFDTVHVLCQLQCLRHNRTSH